MISDNFNVKRTYTLIIIRHTDLDDMSNCHFDDNDEGHFSSLVVSYYPSFTTSLVETEGVGLGDYGQGLRTTI